MKSEQLRNKIKEIDEKKRLQNSTDTFQTKKETPQYLINQIDEVKLIKSKKLEVLNAKENEELIKEKEHRHRKNNLMDVKQDYLEELKLLEDIKMKQEIEAKKFKQRREAYQVLTHQIEENNIKRIKENEEKEKEQKQMRLHLERLLEDEAKEREVQHERKVELRSELAKANEKMIEHKQYLKELEHEEEMKVKE